MVNADNKRVVSEAEYASSAGRLQARSILATNMAPNRNEFEKNLSRLSVGSENLQTQVSSRFYHYIIRCFCYKISDDSFVWFD